VKKTKRGKRSMKIIKQALNKINSINKKQKDFFILLVQGLIGVAGKRTFRNLSRYLEITEHTIARQMTKAFDFIGLNVELIKLARKNNDIYIAAQDETFSTKSGNKTYGLGYFWNGSASKTEKGLAIDTIAAIKINGAEKDGYTISAAQIPANEKPKKTNNQKIIDEPTKIDFSLKHVKTVMPQLLDLGIKYMAADAFFAKIKYVNGIADLGLYVISKLRKDARLLRIYTGPQKARGRKKKFDTEKVNINDFKGSIVTQLDNEKVELLSCIAHSVSLNRIIKVVWVRKFFGDGKCGEAFLFSTDAELDAINIFQYYVARFQIEFIFRDAKGFTGFSDCQSRDARRMHYHFNASLTALNVAKLQDHELQNNNKTQHAFSMSNWSRIYHVEIVINRFISMFGFDPTFIKSHPDFNNMLTFGNVKY
jgi:Transposase DDE domain